VFLPTFSFLCFFCFMLICQLAIGGQKGGGFCHHRIEVILVKKIITVYMLEREKKTKTKGHTKLLHNSVFHSKILIKYEYVIHPLVILCP
jgi:hypothetical protein